MRPEDVVTNDKTKQPDQSASQSLGRGSRSGWKIIMLSSPTWGRNCGGWAAKC